MIISVVNATSGNVPDDKIQEVIRAVNRQIAEDFAPYWGRTATLRLEGAPIDGSSNANPLELRGDSIIYLRDVVDVDNALGYHDLNNRGVPFGVVFTELASELDGRWSITFSHEALEQIMDPEVNLLVAGPHPEDPNREVMHWYEVCDPVQAQHYEIDEVFVSNFVLPLYYTEGDEPGRRNDFLGARDGIEELASFGVAPGGYVGFYDPFEGGHDSFSRAGDEEAERRRALKAEMSYTSRLVRHQREHVRDPDEAMRNLTVVPGRDGPWLERISLDVLPGRGDAPLSRAVRVVREVLDEDCDVEPVHQDIGEFELKPKRALSSADAWNWTYRLRDHPEVVFAEPLFAACMQDREAELELGIRRERRVRASSSGGSGGTAPPFDWSIKKISAPQAWAVAPTQASKGQGIKIAHPDTGWRRHPEIVGTGGGSGRIRSDEGQDFVDSDSNAEDELRDRGVLENPGHGTATASVIMSAEGKESKDYATAVVGVAPHAELIPLRVVKSVVLFSSRNLRRAIDYTIDKDYHVISMSLGGLPSWSLHRTIRRAVDRGIIVLAAAGNQVRFVVWPARYEEVVAVAACDPEGRPWSGSSRGRAVSLTAPGHLVWRASSQRNDADGFDWGTAPSSGTSYAVATTAGVAALWLAHHGRDVLIRRYGRSGLVSAFREVVRLGSDPHPALPPSKFGSGIINAEKVLNIPLPPPRARARARVRTAPMVGPAPRTDHSIEAISSLFESASRGAVRRSLSDFLGLEDADLDAELDSVGEEILMNLVVDPGLHAAMASRMAALATDSSDGARMRSIGVTTVQQAIRRRGVSERLSQRVGGER